LAGNNSCCRVGGRVEGRVGRGRIKSHWLEIAIVSGSFSGILTTFMDGTCVRRTVNVTNVHKYYLRMIIIKDTSAIIFIAMHIFSTSNGVAMSAVVKPVVATPVSEVVASNCWSGRAGSAFVAYRMREVGA